MELNHAEKIIVEQIKNQNSIFVFPSQIAATRWAEYATQITSTKAVPKERFIAWDNFKESSIRSKNQDKKAIPQILRKIFAIQLVAENAKKPFLKYFITEEYSKEASHFANWIASILPSLALWKRYAKQNIDEQDKDLQEIYERYEKFLQENALFEQAWETPPFESDGNKYFLFFPEILEDYDEYKFILENTDDIELVKTEGSEKCTNNAGVLVFENARDEIKNAAIYLRKLHNEDKIDWQDIAISVNEMESYGPYLMRELELFQIPYVSRYAKPLSASGAGGFFAQAENCVQNNFDFASIRNLILNNELPWNDLTSIQQLIEFGQVYHCICSFNEENKKIDVWLKTFSENSQKEMRAKNFYVKLKTEITNMVQAKTFAEIRKNYFIFRNDFFDLSKCSEKSDRILSRCIAELSEIINLEQEFENCTVPSPFSFFAKILSEKKYLEQTAKEGVILVDYRLSASAPFKCQIVLNASQSSTSVVYKKLPFLLETKRKELFRENLENNVSEFFIKLYILNSTEKKFMFSCAKRTFSGYAQSVSYLEEKNADEIEDLKEELAKNPYKIEKNWLLKNDDVPEKFFEVQKQSLYSWLKTGSEKVEKMAKASNSEAGDSRAGNIEAVDSGAGNIEAGENAKSIKDSADKLSKKNKISATQLKTFYDCPRKYLFEKKLYLEEESSDAELLDSFTMGNVGHKIFELFLKELKKKNLPLRAVIIDEKNGEKGKNFTLPDDYIKIFDKCVEKALLFEDNDKNRNSFTVKTLFQATKDSVRQTYLMALADFSRIFEGFFVKESEATVIYENFTGIIDCILIDSSDNETYLVDFKNSNLAIPKNLYTENYGCTNEKKGDFQMPLYLYLYEKVYGIQIENALFFSFSELAEINSIGTRCVPVAGLSIFEKYKKLCPKSQRDEISMDKFKSEIEMTLNFSEEFSQKLKAEDFSINKRLQNYTKCRDCPYKAICRTTFNVAKKD